jgi:hypothetical protein
MRSFFSSGKGEKMTKIQIQKALSAGPPLRCSIWFPSQVLNFAIFGTSLVLGGLPSRQLRCQLLINLTTRGLHDWSTSFVSTANKDK